MSPGNSLASVSSRSRATSWSASGPEPEAPRTVSLGDRLAVLLATVGGIGRFPVAPGTVASAVTAVGLWAIPFSTAGLVFFVLAVTVIGTGAAHRAEPLLGGKDPGSIVIDEVAGMALAVLTLPRTPLVLGLAFLLFRLFDITKPFPARGSQRLPGGVGVMIDDLIAGLYALAILVLLRAVTGWP